jgi:hypothetical protein
MFGPVRATCVLPLKSLEVFSAQGHTGSLGESDMIPYYHGILEYWSTGVMVEMKTRFVKVFLSNTPSLQSLRDFSHEKFRI